jgi:acetylornithine deacetylase
MTATRADWTNMLGRLVGFPTVSADSNRNLIDFIAEYLSGHGIKADVEVTADGEKADLFATVGPMVEGGIVLSGHSDVVPVADQDWTSDPFAMVERDGRLIGRGTTDMKGFIAVVLALVPEWTRRGLKVPFHLAFSYDEEIGCLGAPGLVRRLSERVPRPHAAIIGEPTEHKVVGAHKGISAFTTTVTGKPAHSSDPRTGVNANVAAARCIQFLDELQAEFREASNGGDGSAFGAEFDPPYSTFNIGLVDGGSAVNIIAAKCKFIWECRAIAGTDADAARRRFDAFVAEKINPEMAARAPGTGVKTELLTSAPPLVADENSAAVALALQLTGENQVRAVPFATEAGIFQGAGIPAIVCGPGSVRQAHQPDEFIELSELDACAAFLRRLADWASDGARA